MFSLLSDIFAPKIQNRPPPSPYEGSLLIEAKNEAGESIFLLEPVPPLHSYTRDEHGRVVFPYDEKTLPP
jgi:hypothetical protein